MATYVLNAIAAPDNFTPAATIEGVHIRRINLDVFNQPIYWQLQIPTTESGAGAWDTVEVYMAPGSRSLYRHCTGIRVRAVTPGPGVQVPVVTVEAVTE